MSKLKKLVKRPGLFFKDAIERRLQNLKLPPNTRAIASSYRTGKPTAILIGFSEWKTWMREILPGHNVIFMGHSPRPPQALLRTIPLYCRPEVYVWSYKFPPMVQDICRDHGIALTYVEDGFLRSVGLGIEKTKPLSLVFDKRAMHFDAQKQSDLDHILNSTDFLNDSSIIGDAHTIAIAIRNGLSKYLRADSGGSLRDALDLRPGERVVLVLGQVEDDLSIRFGAEKFLSANDLVEIAAAEHPTARILLRPHPETLVRAKEHYSDPNSVRHLCDIVDERWSLNETLDIADHVYTITSFSGFEAALRGKQVDLFGLPFYGGWGFTNDRHNIPMSTKRRQELSPIQVLAGALVLYPRYFHPDTMRQFSPHEAIMVAQSMMTRLAAEVTGTERHPLPVRRFDPIATLPEVSASGERISGAGGSHFREDRETLRPEMEFLAQHGQIAAAARFRGSIAAQAAGK